MSQVLTSKSERKAACYEHKASFNHTLYSNKEIITKIGQKNLLLEIFYSPHQLSPGHFLAYQSQKTSPYCSRIEMEV